jgi:hypothetical protein
MKYNSPKNGHFVFVVILILSGCSSFVKTADRPEINSVESQSANALTNIKTFDSNMSAAEFEKYAYELGYNPKGVMTTSEIELVKDRSTLRRLERAVESDREQMHYAKILPLLRTDREKIDYLSLPSLQGRLAWANRNKIWDRSRPDSKLVDISDRQDIAVGMTTQLVRRAWGEPESVEASGNPIYKNERWKYVKDVPTSNGYKRERRYVFFESGRVVGWETE